MPDLIDAKTKKELLPVLKHLKAPVRLVFFTQEHPCVACREQEGLEAVEGTDRLDLNVDGVFLEIGLLPNSSPVKDLVKLNDLGEIEVNRNQSTSIPGFYAAGDVTDETEKQIVIAAGAGAKAALAAHACLMDQKLLVLK